MENSEEKIESMDQKEITTKVTTSGNTAQIAGAVLVAGFLIAGAILLKGNMPDRSPSNLDNGINAENIELSPVTKEDHINGNTRAKIIIVEYSDLECPFCKVFHNTMNQVMKTNKNVAWVYRHYPIPQLHKKAFKESEASECAWEQGGNTAFWQYIDKVFEITTSNDGLDVAELPKIAQSIGLNVTSFNTCLESGKYQTKVQADIDNGVTAGVRGTPKSFILRNGKIVDTIDGAQPIEMVQTKIEKALK
jgi:protein-disulfide isomerase